MKALRVIFVGAFFFALHTAFLAYINSTVLSQIVGTGKIGVIYTLASLLSLLLILHAPHILERIGNRKTAGRAFFVSSLFLVLLGVTSGPIVVPIFILYFSLNAIILYTVDIFIEHYSKEGATGNIRGLYLVISNLGWVIAPTISGIIETRFGFQTLYLLAGICVAISGLIFWISQKRFSDAVYKKSHLTDGLKTLIRNKNVRIVTLLNLSLQMFFVLMVLYSPLYLTQIIGFSWKSLGVLLSIMLTPFVLFPYPAGRIADKYLGEKELLVGGFLIAAAAILFLTEINAPIFLYFAIVLFTSRVGASIVEAMCESYFFKQVNDTDTSVISTYRTMLPVAYIIGPIIAGILFSLGSYSLVFTGAATLLVISALGALFLKDTR